MSSSLAYVKSFNDAKTNDNQTPYVAIKDGLAYPFSWCLAWLNLLRFSNPNPEKKKT